MSECRFSAVVLSAGSGSRMKSDIPKQYMKLREKPLIYYTLKSFQESKVDEIVLVIGKDDREYVQKEILDKYHFNKVRKLVDGGSERVWSVKNGLMESSGDYVLIHDGARAFISPDLINRMADAAVEHGAAVAAVPSKDTIKVSDEDSFVESTPDRSRLWVVQTPQAFKKEKLMSAYEIAEKKDRTLSGVTDDAGVMEAAGGKVRLIMGEYTNIKVTTPEDMAFGAAIIDSSEETELCNSMK